MGTKFTLSLHIIPSPSVSLTFCSHFFSHSLDGIFPIVYLCTTRHDDNYKDVRVSLSMGLVKIRAVCPCVYNGGRDSRGLEFIADA